jgi:hypothetical protein
MCEEEVFSTEGSEQLKEEDIGYIGLGDRLTVDGPQKFVRAATD